MMAGQLLYTPIVFEKSMPFYTFKMDVLKKYSVVVVKAESAVGAHSH
jgi:hypothetical protein